MKEENINRVLDIGIKIICLKGYHHLGLRELLEKAKIPSGSFYYYFKSKEDFALKAAKYYGDTVEQYFRNKLLQDDIDHVVQFQSLFDEEIDRLKSNDLKEGCVLGDLGTEVSSQMAEVRRVVEDKYRSWQTIISTFFKHGQKVGVFNKQFDPEEMALFFISNRQGALTRVKTSETITPYEVFSEMMLKIVL